MYVMCISAVLDGEARLTKQAYQSTELGIQCSKPIVSQV